MFTIFFWAKPDFGDEVMLSARVTAENGPEAWRKFWNIHPDYGMFVPDEFGRVFDGSRLVATIVEIPEA